MRRNLAQPRRLIFGVGILFTVALLYQAFIIIPSRINLSPFDAHNTATFEDGSLLGSKLSQEPIKISKILLSSKSRNPTNSLGVDRIEDTDGNSEEEGDLDEDVGVAEDGDPDSELVVELGDGVVLTKVKDPVGRLVRLTSSRESVGEHDYDQIDLVSDGISRPSFSSVPKSLGVGSNETGSRNELTKSTLSVKKKKKKKGIFPPISISEMNEILVRNHASYHSMRPRWFSARDKELLAAKALIENAPAVKNDQQLYAPAFRNISKFKRSYELMEKMLKVYVYKEGSKPIFHQPLLKGIYASEGWFMKLMETNRQYVVKDPRKAHLFYMPFSSRLLQFALYVRNSHSRRNLEQHLIDYVNTIAAKHPFWNRTGGSDHFFVACHDWAPYETRRAMERSIQALCVADMHLKFRLGKDVSLPETYLRSAKNPVKDLGGMPASNRSILAFYSGSKHGPLRSVLLEHWENKDPDMKIYGPLPRGIARKVAYIEHMKNSKYCVCPKGYEVNSPRVVESIFYECVPVIISDNFVPPFFEVLNWEAFSLILPEDDVPRLGEILRAIPDEKYLLLQQGVRRVQQHFLWHNKPVKYDLFHMTLHSIWYNRVYNVRTR